MSWRLYFSLLFIVTTEVISVRFLEWVDTFTECHIGMHKISHQFEHLALSGLKCLSGVTLKRNIVHERSKEMI